MHREISDNTNGQTKQNVNVFSALSNQGPIIADVTDEPENTAVVGLNERAAVVPMLTATHLQPTSSNTAQLPSLNASTSLNAISLSPSLDRQISEELAEYLSGQEQSIDNCRDLLGNCWDAMMNDDVENGESTADFERQPLMLEGGDPILTLDEVPTTPDLLTPLASPSQNNT